MHLANLLEKKQNFHLNFESDLGNYFGSKNPVKICRLFQLEETLNF